MPRRTLSAVPDSMLRQYLDTALWASCDDGGEPLDRNYDSGQVTRASIHDARVDIRDFLSMCDDAGIPVDEYDAGDIGHNLWLTRNRHGAGFWDRGWGADGDGMTRIAHSLGEIDPYVNRRRVHIRR